MSVSYFIRDAALDYEIKVVTEVYQEPIRKDYTVLIKSTVDCIRTLEFRMNRAQSDFQKGLKCLGTDPDLFHPSCNPPPPHHGNLGQPHKRAHHLAW